MNNQEYERQKRRNAVASNLKEAEAADRARKLAANIRYLIWCEVCWQRMDAHDDHGNCTMTTLDNLKRGSCKCVGKYDADLTRRVEENAGDVMVEVIHTGSYRKQCDSCDDDIPGNGGGYYYTAGNGEVLCPACFNRDMRLEGGK